MSENKLRSIKFTHESLFTNTGGNSGFRTKTVEYSIGRETTREISKETMTNIAASIEFEAPIGVSGSAGAEHERGFGEVKNNGY